jgi:hypothetical protein
MSGAHVDGSRLPVTGSLVPFHGQQLCWVLLLSLVSYSSCFLLQTPLAIFRVTHHHQPGISTVIFGSLTQIGFFYNLIFLANQYFTIRHIQKVKQLNEILI